MAATAALYSSLGKVSAPRKQSLTETILEGLRVGVAKELENDGLVTVDSTVDDYDFVDDINDEDDESSYCHWCNTPQLADDFISVLQRTLVRLSTSDNRYTYIPNPLLPLFNPETFSTPPTDEEVDMMIDYIASLRQYHRHSEDMFDERGRVWGHELAEYGFEVPLGTKVLLEAGTSGFIARMRDGWYHFDEVGCRACLIATGDKDAIIRILGRDERVYEGQWFELPCGCDVDEGVFTMDDVSGMREDEGVVEDL